jgi:hypothetical protein
MTGRSQLPVLLLLGVQMGRSQLVLQAQKDHWELRAFALQSQQGRS